MRFGTGVKSYEYDIVLSPDDTAPCRVAKATSTSPPSNHVYPFGTTVQALDKDILMVQLTVTGNKRASDYWVEIKITQDVTPRGTPTVYKDTLKTISYKSPQYLFTLV